MGFKYKIQNPASIYFVTNTIVNWIDLFTKPPYAEILINSLDHCIATKGLQVHAWCIMPSHVHLLVSASLPNISLSDIMRDSKKFTSKKIIDAVILNNESRKEWLLDKFEFAGRFNSKIKDYKVWQDGFHPIECYSRDFFLQKLNYIHDNPVAAGLVKQPWYFALSSAIDYYETKKGLINIEKVDI